MIIYPAIDLINGQCVRLYKGQFESKTVYNCDPRDVAKSYHDAGAQWLHLVDLDGAKNPRHRQSQIIGDIVRGAGLKIQTGGGIRTRDDVVQLFDLGVSRIVIGSLAVSNPVLTLSFFQEFGADKICLALDVIPDHNGIFRVAVSGWQETSAQELTSVIDHYGLHGLQHLLCTDISKDGTMGGCNIMLYQTLKQKFPALNIMASGGIHNLDNLRELKQAGIGGAVIGKALYEGAFTVQEALSC